ncbi:hypothetical protein Tco_0951186 [Tanacetum coccineum]|uniref:Uncharacterized protein n=1 Tax=Tanacetum coccineum TaxID=301880 RepID=A0ABQ5DTD7_9ASTR
MAVLESCPKHNMVAYLEKTAGNAEFHEVINFLARSSIHNALTVSPVVSTTFVEQFWMSAKSKIINNVRYITAKVAGKPVSISEASIRSDLLFDDADGIDSLPNQAIFDAIQLMGYEGDLTVLTFNKALHLDAKKKFVMYPRFISIFLDKQLMNVPVPLDHFPVNALTSKVFSFMVKKGKHFSGKVTPLFASMLVQPTEDEGATSERPSDPQPTPSPPHPREANVEPQTDPSPRPSPSTHIPDSIPESSGGNHGGQSSSDKSLSGNEGDMTLQSVYDLCISLCTQVTDQAKEIKHLKAQIKKLQKKAKPVITHHRAWMKSVSLKKRLAGKKSKESVPHTACRPSAIRPRDQDDPHDDAHPEGENSAKRQKTSEYEAYVSGESSSGQVNVEEPGPSTSGNQEQDDEFDFWTDSYASDDDEIPTKQVSQDIMEEISLTIDEAKLKKMADEMLRQRCTSGDEHQYHIDQMKNFLQSDIVWESRKEILVSPHPRKITPLVQSCQRDPEAPALSLINQDLLYLKKGNSGPEKIVLSLHKFPAIVFNDDDIEERTSRWVNKCIKKFNPYARYGVENWKNPHAKIFYIRRQKEPGRPKEEIYSNSKIVQVIKTFWELGHEHKFITEIVARRANDCIVSITEPDYKNLNKNDIEDMYLLIMNNKVPDYADTGLLWSLSVFIRSSVIWERVHDFQLGIESYQQKINLTAPTITFPGIEECDVFSIVYEPVHGIIYTNSKKEKRVMRPSEIHKFCDATLRRTLEGLKSYYNDVKYGYVQKELTNDELEFLKLFEEEIEVRLKYRDQMRR